jgi:hypothetical protein
MFLLQQGILNSDSISKAGGSIGKSFRSSESFVVFVNQIIAYAFLAAGVLSVAFIFWGGIKLILSGGDDEKIKGAIGSIRHAIIGLIVTILSFTAVAFVGRIFGLDLISYISMEKIWELITNLTAE